VALIPRPLLPILGEGEQVGRRASGRRWCRSVASGKVFHKCEVSRCSVLGIRTEALRAVARSKCSLGRARPYGAGLTRASRIDIRGSLAPSRRPFAEIHPVPIEGHHLARTKRTVEPTVSDPGGVRPSSRCVRDQHVRLKQQYCPVSIFQRCY